MHVVFDLLLSLIISSTILISFFLYFFFFQRYGPPRDLHSFPTRRSSDLPAGWRPSARAQQQFTRKLTLAEAVKHWQWYGLRSEEHTSELQSRVDLVCRLLLEKKKKKKYEKWKICRACK